MLNSHSYYIHRISYIISIIVSRKLCSYTLIAFIGDAVEYLAKKNYIPIKPHGRCARHSVCARTWHAA